VSTVVRDSGWKSGVRRGLLLEYPDHGKTAQLWTTTHNPVPGIPATNPVDHILAVTIIGDMSRASLSKSLQAASCSDAGAVYDIDGCRLELCNMEHKDHRNPAVGVCPWGSSPGGADLYRASETFSNWVYSKCLQPKKNGPYYEMGCTTLNVSTSSKVRVTIGLIQSIFNSLSNGDKFLDLHHIHIAKLLHTSAQNYANHGPPSGITDEYELFRAVCNAIEDRDSSCESAALAYPNMRNTTSVPDWVNALMTVAEKRPELVGGSTGVSSVPEFIGMASVCGIKLEPHVMLRMVIERVLRKCPCLKDTNPFQAVGDLVQYVICSLGDIIAKSLRYHILMYKTYEWLSTNMMDTLLLNSIIELREQLNAQHSIATLISVLMPHNTLSDEMIAEVLLQTKSGINPGVVVLPERFLREPLKPVMLYNVIAANLARDKSDREADEKARKLLTNLKEWQRITKLIAESPMPTDPQLCKLLWKEYLVTRPPRDLRTCVAQLAVHGPENVCIAFIRGASDNGFGPGFKPRYSRLLTVAMLAIDANASTEGPRPIENHINWRNMNSVGVSEKNHHAIRITSQAVGVFETKMRVVDKLNDDCQHSELEVLTIEESASRSKGVMRKIYIIEQNENADNVCPICIDETKRNPNKLHDHPGGLCDTCFEKVKLYRMACPLCNMPLPAVQYAAPL